MNHGDLIDKYAADHQVSKADAKKAVEGVFSLVADTMAKGEEVRVNNFGVFSSKHKPASKGRNPSTGAEVDIAARNAPAFKALKGLKDKLNETAAKG